MAQAFGGIARESKQHQTADDHAARSVARARLRPASSRALQQERKTRNCGRERFLEGIRGFAHTRDVAAQPGAAYGFGQRCCDDVRKIRPLRALERAREKLYLERALAASACDIAAQTQKH